MLYRLFCFLGKAAVESYVGFYLFTFIAAWVSNALAGTHFDLSQLSDLFKWLIANHAVNSVFNSKIGEALKNEDCKSDRHPDDG